MRKARTSLGAAALLLLVAAVAQAQPALTTIPGTPLRINVGSDGSFQIFNAAVPGVGQIYPTTSTLADMGVFAWIDGQLFAPDFAAHGVTATRDLGTYTPWAGGSLSQLSGAGTTDSPYVVSVALGASGTDVRTTVTVQYVNGDNFFRVSNVFYTTDGTPHTIDAILGADIYLAASDFGTFVTVPSLAAVGGHNCDPADGDYNILLIPVTAASRFTTAFYVDVWAQIGTNQLNNNTTGAGCVDNGAAIEWNDIMSGAPDSAVELKTAVSFGEIPSVENFHGFSINVQPSSVELKPGESVPLTITTQHNPALGFDAGIQLNAPGLPPGMTITFDNDNIPAPGDGTVNAMLTLDPMTFPRLYESVGVYGSGGTETHGAFLSVNVLCTPPVILSLASSQPQSQSVPRGSTATLTVKPEGAGAYTYTWYNSHAPLPFNEVPNSNSATLVTGPVNEPQEYWVRVTNACGTANSYTATVIPTP